MPLSSLPGQADRLAALPLLVVAGIVSRLDARPLQERELPAGAPVSLELEATEQALVFTSRTEGRCHVWASSQALDPRLRLLSSSGEELASDEDGGGGTTAFLAFAVQPGEDYVLVVGAEDGASGPVEVRRVACAETPASREAVRRAREARVGARELIGSVRMEEACAQIDAARAELTSVLAETKSIEAADELWQLGLLAGQAANVPLVEACFEPVLELRERSLPPGHEERFVARFNFDWILHLNGESRLARDRFASTWEECRRLRGEDDLFVARMAVSLAFLEWRLGRGDLAWELLVPADQRLQRELPESHIDRVWASLQRARLLTERGALQEALELFEKLVDLTDPQGGDFDPNRTWILSGLADLLRELGRLDRARELCEQVLEQRRAWLPADHPDVLWAELGLSAVLADQGHEREARELKEHVLAVRERQLPPGHLDVLEARSALAASCFQMGDLRRALELQEAVLEDLDPDLPAENPARLKALGNLSLTLAAIGDPRRAVELAEEVLAIRERTKGEDDPALRRARQNASIALFDVGELERARELAERALTTAERTLGEDHVDLQSARTNLALVLHGLGDYAGQRDLLEQVVESASRTLPADSLDLARYRIQLGHAWRHLDELDRALDLQRRVLETVQATWGDRHSVAIRARSELGQIYWMLNRLDKLVPLLEEELELRLADTTESIDVQSTRVRLAWALSAHGEEQRAEELLRSVLAEREETLPETSPLIRSPLRCLLGLAVEQQHLEQATDLGQRLIRSVLEDVRSTALAISPREMEDYALNQHASVSSCLTLSSRLGTTAEAERFRAETFTLVESMRGMGTIQARLLVSRGDEPELERLRQRVRRASLDLVAFAQGEGGRDEITAARLERDAALRELTAYLHATTAVEELLEDATPERVAATLATDQVAVGFVGYARMGVDGRKWTQTGIPSLAAHVLRPDGALALVDLGPRDAIDAAVSAWRDALRAPRERGQGLGLESLENSQRARGEELRRLVFDPLRSHFGEARELVVALDDVLHSVPLDALPDGDALLGDTLRIAVRPTLRELAWPPREAAAGGLVALGGASFNTRPEEEGEPEDEEPARLAVGSARRSSAWERGFAPLPFTTSEVRGIAALYEEIVEAEQAPLVLLKRRASRGEVEAAAPGARWLHLATHGWFTPESVRGIEEAMAVDAGLGIEIGVTREERIRASSPMVLCGLALAGANLPPDEFGRLPGVLTAEEVASWDLAGCDLAVLSACETNVGVQRAGQGVASLQKALHKAGARSVVTSLWKVPDEATQVLMLEFYRRLWALGEPKAVALWKAKQMLRDARDPKGQPVYSTRDWAAWVLTGEPD